MASTIRTHGSTSVLTPLFLSALYFLICFFAFLMRVFLSFRERLLNSSIADFTDEGSGSLVAAAATEDSGTDNAADE